MSHDGPCLKKQESCMPIKGIQLFFYIIQNQNVILYIIIAIPSEIPINALALFVLLANPTSPKTMADTSIGFFVKDGLYYQLLPFIGIVLKIDGEISFNDVI